MSLKHTSVIFHNTNQSKDLSYYVITVAEFQAFPGAGHLKPLIPIPIVSEYRRIV
jgi:hypothetical protein